MSELLLQTPETSERRLSDGIDYYKLTMGQLALLLHSKDIVKFALKNRTADAPLTRYVDKEDLVARIKTIQQNGMTLEEIDYIRSIKATDDSQLFGEEYLGHLEHLELPDVSVEINPETGDFDIHTTGEWPSVSLWETVIMSELNELHFKGLIEKENLSLEALYEEGDRRLTEKIEKLRSRPDIKFIDFGTRRRFSAQWHDHVIGRLVRELPDNFIGTSNPHFAKKYGIKPVGTYAHEMPMVYAALEDAKGENPLVGHSKMLEDWEEYYGLKGLSIALTDTFTSEFFFADFAEHGALTWNGLRHDSGDPIEFGERAIRFYEHYGVDPMERTLVFSDGLDIDEIIRLADHFAGKINLVFGWGTTLTNDFGLQTLNIVMKAVEVNGHPTVKTSDVRGKQTGPPEVVERYYARIDEAVERSLREMSL